MICKIRFRCQRRLRIAPIYSSKTVFPFCVVDTLSEIKNTAVLAFP
jgi:hypothetical protein